jgi:hypothetical protein
MMQVIEGSEMPLPKSNYGNSILQLYTAKQMCEYGKLCIETYKKIQNAPPAAKVETHMTMTNAVVADMFPEV